MWTHVCHVEFKTHLSLASSFCARHKKRTVCIQASHLGIVLFSLSGRKSSLIFLAFIISEGFRTIIWSNASQFVYLIFPHDYIFI